mgnify:CR=1 FL=1
MSSSIFIKTLLNDLNDISEEFTSNKAEVNDIISTQEAEITNLKSSVATHDSSISALASDKQNKLNVLSDIIVKNITTTTINNVSASSLTNASTDIANLSSSLDNVWSATRQLQIDTLKANSPIVVTRINEMPVNQILSSVNDTNVVKSMLGDIYDSIEVVVKYFATCFIYKERNSSRKAAGTQRPGHKGMHKLWYHYYILY